MNPELKDLRVAVVPTETGNGIDQSSTYEEIVACEETLYYSVPDYFKAQNDEELPACHWSFLLDYNKKTDCTGMNTDGIDYDSKAQKIAYIKKVIGDWGSTSCCERERDHSPSMNSLAGGRVCELVEDFQLDCVGTVVYDDDNEVDWNNYNYDELSDEVLDEIVEIMEDYEADMLKTEKRCSN
jgi:hypothetical protein